jgi:hypothetical protein
LHPAVISGDIVGISYKGKEPGACRGKTDQGIQSDASAAYGPAAEEYQYPSGNESGQGDVSRKISEYVL